MSFDPTNPLLAERTVAVVGYGSQGRAQARNLHDSGARVVVGVREGGPSWDRVAEDGLQRATVSEATAQADLVALLVPDMEQPSVFEEQMRPNLKPGAVLLFSHGFNVHYGRLEAGPETPVVMIAPKGPGNLVRRTYEEGRGVPCLLAVHQDPKGDAHALAHAYAELIGGTRAGVIDTTFAEETETDLFGEQAVLCGGVTELITAGFETLVEAGYDPRVAFFECCHELKLIVDLIYEGGFRRMHRFVSETASYGDVSRGPRVITEETRERMRDVLTAIQDGTFAEEWAAEFSAGGGQFRALQKADETHPLQDVGDRMRAGFSWNAEEDTAPSEPAATETGA